MMKNRWIGARGLAGLLALSLGWAAQAGAVFSETDRELVGTGDFDGDGRLDVVLVDRASGKYRLGYQSADGAPTWVNHRLSGIKGVTGLGTGRLFGPNQDGLAIAGADVNQVNVVEAANPGVPGKPIPLSLNALGPNVAVAIDLGGAGNTPLHDLYVPSLYDEPKKATLLRNTEGKFEVLAEPELDAALAHVLRLALKAAGPEFLVAIANTDKGDVLRVQDLSGAKPRKVAEAVGLPKGAAYAVGYFRGGPLCEFVIYKPGESTLQVRAVAEPSAGVYELGEAKAFDLGKPLRLVVAVPGEKRSQLLALFGKGELAEVYKFDGASPPESVQQIAPKAGDLLFTAVSLEKSFLVLSGPDFSKFSTHCQVFQFSGATNTAGLYGKLASMADSDDATVPEIHQRLVTALQAEQVASQGDMRPYTNTIPGTQVSYAMVVIPGGEFTMGSPAAEPGRNPDEGPQHQVKLSPFWMGCREVTWNEYEWFMFPDDEKKLRETTPTDEGINKVSDAVTRPSKPYMEMSFGMGKEGYPAISMTQHAANKYCHWLSAKTGHFYRLPTEAEWEYACRAGRTNAYFFGDDPAKLAEYAWYEQNSDFKYAKVGKKKPSPWGLFDIHGNVAEWCLDQYETNYARALVMPEDPWLRATLAYPHAARGGSYDDEAVKLRSAARRGSDRSWKMRDPQLPKSIWWLTDAQFVGFRLVRPLNIPPPQDLQKCWTSGVEKD